MNCTARNKKNIFIVSCIVIYVIMYFCFAKTNGTSFISMFHNFPNDTYMDMFNSIYVINPLQIKNPYELGSQYPPLCYLIYFLFAKLIPTELFNENAIFIRDTMSGRIIVSIYISIICISMSSIIFAFEKNIKNSCLISFIFLFSFPSMYAIERCNIIYISFICVAIFCLGYESSNNLVKHFSLICLAIASALKIYPALFGLVLINKRKYKEAFYAIIYGLLFFFIPFMFFGGASSISLFINNIFNVSEEMAVKGYGYKVGISSILGYTLKIFKINASSEIYDRMSIIIKFFILLFGITSMIFCKFKEKWKMFAIPSILINLIFDYSFIYTLLFLIIPIMYFLNDETYISRKIDYMYLIIFIVILIPIVNINIDNLDVFRNDYYPLNLSTIIKSISNFILYIILLVDIFINNRKEKI